LLFVQAGKSSAHVLGRPSGVAAAVARLEAVTFTVVVSLELAAPYLALLGNNRAALANAIGDQHNTKVHD
jgi:hypothetical protein